MQINALLNTFPQPLIQREPALGPVSVAARRAERTKDSVEISDAARDASGEPLSEQDQEKVEDLDIRDREVRQHEQAHVAAAGDLFRGGPTYSFETGPDGKRYAVGGKVQIDTSEGRTPEETIRKAAQIKRSALAPAEPSSTDRAVAAKADRLATEARAELSEEQLRGSEDQPGTDAPAEGLSSRGAEAIRAYSESDSPEASFETFA